MVTITTIFATKKEPLLINLLYQLLQYVGRTQLQPTVKTVGLVSFRRNPIQSHFLRNLSGPYWMGPGEPITNQFWQVIYCSANPVILTLSTRTILLMLEYLLYSLSSLKIVVTTHTIHVWYVYLHLP